MAAFKPMLVVELDTEAQAVYVRFQEGKVVRTQEVETSGDVVTLDFDQADQLIGLELIWV